MYAVDYHPSLARRRPRSPWPKRAWKLAVWCGLIAFAIFGMAEVAYGGGPSGFDQVRVGEGDTIWSIAEQRYPGVDTRGKVEEIRRANGLRGALVYPGQALKVPAQ
jgi:hypothetical protein